MEVLCHVSGGGGDEGGCAVICYGGPVALHCVFLVKTSSFPLLVFFSFFFYAICNPFAKQVEKTH